MQGALEWSEDLYWDVSPPMMGCSLQLLYGAHIEVTTNGQQISPGRPILSKRSL